jgi:nucleotide-binding universal stress UspA family protein
VKVVDRLVRSRSAATAIVEEAERRGAEIIVVGAARRVLVGSHARVFGRTVDYVLKHSPCRVMVVAARDEVAA